MALNSIENKNLTETSEMVIKSRQYFLNMMDQKAKNYGFKKALSLKDKCGWHELSHIELSVQSKRFSDHLKGIGLRRGDRIAILSESRPEWSIALLASMNAGAIAVPLDIKLTDSEFKNILTDCCPKVICASENYIKTAIKLQNSISSIEHVISIHESASDSTLEPCSYYIESCDFQNIDPDETALIVYTSGTTGNPKGVMISFANIITQLQDYEEIFDIRPTDSLLSILPLNHLLELNGGLIEMLHRGAHINYTKSLNPKEITRIMQERQITYMITVPLFIKMLKTSIEKEIRKSSKASQNSFRIMYKLAIFIPVSARKVLFSKIHKQLGGKIRGFMCGGAPLDLEVAEFFERIGIPVYQGYGLTETSPTVSTNTNRFNRLGSVGKPLPSVQVRISNQGEILVKGTSLMKGYYNKPEMTKEVIDSDGWFHTGDVGELDEDGYLYITGRIKNMIVLGGGKKIFPEEVEFIIENSDLIKEICVMSARIQGGSKDGTEEVCAVIVPIDELIWKYKDDFEELEKVIKNEVSNYSQNLALYKRPTKIVIHQEELPKTSTRKVKRNLVQDWYYNEYLKKY